MERFLTFFTVITLAANLSSAFQGRPLVSSEFRPPLSRLYSSQNNDPNLNSVGDYVKQVHGGKYQFSDAGINSIGQEFAETGYASSAPKEDAEASLLADIPWWAHRMGTEGDLESRLLRGVIDLCDGPVSVEIVNDERTWEPFYVKVMTTPIPGDQEPTARDFADTQPLSVYPQAGTLAPRGGAVNLCDPQDPYSDSATIQIEVSSSVDLLENESVFLLIGTEEEKWYYRIHF